MISIIFRALALCAFAVISVAAQSNAQASLNVTITDPAGAAVANAKVYVIPPGTLAMTNQRGAAEFTQLAPGKVRLQISADGFAPRNFTDVKIKTGTNQQTVKLEIAVVQEMLTVEQDKREANTDPRGNAFANVLGPEQIALLPDDPDEFEEALKAMAGPGATFRVNGFRGGKLPPKNQIQSIRFRTNQFAAENHESGFMFVDIQTKPGLGNWHGSLGGGFRDESLNARNAFAPFRAPEQTRRINFDLSGPLRKGKTSLALSGDAVNAYDAQTIVAALPEGAFNDVLRRPVHTLNLTGRLEHLLTPLSTLRAEYQRNATRKDNLGAGNFDLAERAYNTDGVNQLMRLSSATTLGKKLFNETRFQVDWKTTDIRSLSQAPTIQVLNAFISGGAQLDSTRRQREIEFADNLDVATKKHALRFGGQIEYLSAQADESRNLNGTFTFSSMAAFRARQPLNYTRRTGPGQVSLNQWQAGWYAQDDWRARKSLMLSFGLRHEWQSNLADQNNFAPRVALAWSPGKNGKTTMRAGAGLFYNWFDTLTLEQALRVNGQQQSDLVVLNPGFPDPLAGGTQRTLPPSRITLDQRMQMPVTAIFNTGLERELRPQLRFNVSYNLRRDTHQLRGRNVNAPDANGVRPDPRAGNLTQVEASANGSAHLLNAGLNWMKMGRFMLSGNYQLAKATNETDSPFSLPVNSRDLRAERGPAANDVRQRLMFFGNYSFPHNLRISSILLAQAATPYNVTTGFDNNNDGIVNDRPANTPRNSARGAGLFELSSRFGWGFSFGKIPEQSGGPTMRAITLDANDSGSMLGALGGMPGGPNSKRYRMEFFLQASNLLNHTNRTGFTGVQASPFFGQATSALPGRRLETGMRLSF